MNKVLFPVTLFALLLLSCNNKSLIIGKWRMAADKSITINFIDDSTGSIESLQNNTPEKVRNFKYEIKNDTLFERTHIRYGFGRWKIIKLDRDSLIINSKNVTVRYYRLP